MVMVIVCFFVLVILLYIYRNIPFSLGYFVSDARSCRLVLKLLVFFSDLSTPAMTIMLFYPVSGLHSNKDRPYFVT